MDYALGLAVFLGVFLGILFVNLILTDLFKEDRSEQIKEMEAELRMQMREHARRSTERDSLQDIDVSEAGGKHFSVVQMYKDFQKAVGQAGLQTDPQMLGFLGLAGGAVLGVLTFFITGSWLVALVVIAIGAVWPFAYIMSKRTQRMNQLGEQLPESLELMSRVLRSGQTITQAMNGVAEEFSDPIGTEFGFCYEQQNLGLPLETALKNLVERTGLIDIKILAMAVGIQRQAGGNLAEMMDNLSNVMRERQKLKGTVQTLTAEGRMQAGFLVALPFMAWLAMFFMNRPYALKLFEHPGLIYATLGLMFLGMVWIRKIVNFDY